MGKSSTGNKLVNAVTDDNPNGSRRIKQVWPKEVERLNPSFKTDPEADSVTKNCCLLVSELEDGGVVQVLDTEGFAGSDVKDVHLGNLRVAREIAGVSTELDLAYNRILYFLPNRGRPERADKTLQDEIDILWFFFGEAIFQNIVLASTVEEGIPSTYAPKEVDVQRVFSAAMKYALDKYGVSEPPPCPPVLFIPWITDSSKLLREVKNVRVRDEAFKPKFRKEVCTKCAIALYWQGTSLLAAKVGKELHTIEDSMCHPTFIPKYTKVERFFGGIAHVVVLGFAKVHELRTKKPTWPGFFNSEEVCANCEQAPGSKGCMRVKEEHEGQVVQHSNNVEGVILGQ